MTANSAADLRHRLRRPDSAVIPSLRKRLAHGYEIAVVAAILTAIAAGAEPSLQQALSGPGGTPQRLFVLAAGTAFLSGLVWLLRAAGPIAASAAFRFWLLASPASRRTLLRPRFLGVIAAATLTMLVAMVPITHIGATGLLLPVALATAGGVCVAAVAVCGQASDVLDHGLRAAGQSFGAVSGVAFGSLATGIGRVSVNAALGMAAAAQLPILCAAAALALCCIWYAYRTLDRIDIGPLSRGQALWTATRASALFLDVSVLSEFAAERRALATGRVPSVRCGQRYVLALLRLEWSRIRRRPSLALRIAGAALLWWGCRPVLGAATITVLALIAGYLVVLPMAATLRQLSARPGLRTQFRPHDRPLRWVSIGCCLLTAGLWTAAILPGLPPVTGAVAVAIPFGLTAAVYRTATRRPLDYSAPAVSTPFGDIPVDLIRQLFRGVFLLAGLILGVILAG